MEPTVRVVNATAPFAMSTGSGHSTAGQKSDDKTCSKIYLILLLTYNALFQCRAS